MARPSLSVAPFDIDGPGPLGTSLAAYFQAGQVTHEALSQQGIELAQTLTLGAGVRYTISLNWAAIQANIGTGYNAEGGVFTLFADSTDLAMQAAGSISYGTPHYGFLTAPYTPTSGGARRVGIRITRPFTIISTTGTAQWVDNAAIVAACYANCDASTTPPILNINDFICFLNRFAAGDPYANCDGSTTPPVLNVLDFTCFLNRFAAGCS
jgi:hypothetical protein